MFSLLALYEGSRIVLSSSIAKRAAAKDPRRAIIIGSGRRAGKAWREVRLLHHPAITLLGFVDNRSTAEMSPDIANRYLGTVDDLSNLLLTEVVDLVLIAMPARSCYALMQEAVNVAESVGAEVICLSDLHSTARQNDVDETLFRELRPKHRTFLKALFFKRLVDVCLSVVGLVVLSPLFLAISLAVRLTSGGPVLFAQRRFGHRRRIFTMYKFRSMVDGAEAMLADLEEANEKDGHLFKMKDDPRVTKVGKFLRRTSLDELPQLWNVLIGNMSLVGPRPMSVRDVSLFSESTLMRRFSVQPGMTGLWQVTGRSNTTFNELIRLDSSYIDEWSLALDLRILYRTIAVVFNRSGAM